MKIIRIAAAGAVFGAAAIAGALIVTASNQNGSADNIAFSGEPLGVLATPLVQLPDDARTEAIENEVGPEARAHLAGKSNGVTVYIVEHPDGGVCAVSIEPDQVGMMCGADDLIGTGQLVMRSQVLPTDRALFVGVAPNDVTTAVIDGVDTEVVNNVWIATGNPDTYDYTVRSDSSERTGTVGGATTPQAIPGTTTPAD